MTGLGVYCVVWLISFYITHVYNIRNKLSAAFNITNMSTFIMGIFMLVAWSIDSNIANWEFYSMMGVAHLFGHATAVYIKESEDDHSLNHNDWDDDDFEKVDMTGCDGQRKETYIIVEEKTIIPPDNYSLDAVTRAQEDWKNFKW